MEEQDSTKLDEEPKVDAGEAIAPGSDTLTSADMFSTEVIRAFRHQNFEHYDEAYIGAPDSYARPAFNASFVDGLINPIEDYIDRPDNLAVK